MAISPGKPTTGAYSVPSTVFDTDSNGGPLQLQSDGFNGGPAYADYRADSSGVVSQIDSTGSVDWNLDLRNSSRGLSLTIATMAGGSVNGLPVGPTFYSGRAVSRCFNPAGGTTAYRRFSIVGANPNCAMRVNFTYGLTNDTLVMSPLYAGTGLAEVCCNGSSGSSCVDWTILPNANAVNAGVANLYSISRSGAEKFVAACKLTFRVHVTYPWDGMSGVAEGNRRPVIRREAVNDDGTGGGRVKVLSLFLVWRTAAVSSRSLREGPAART